MRAPFDVLLFAVLGLLSFAQADTYHYYDEPVKRNALSDLLAKLNGAHKGAKAKTITETVKQTVKQTVTVAAAAAAVNSTAAVKTITVTQSGQPQVAAQSGLQLSFVTTTVFGSGAPPTVTITALASTVTQQVTMTMIQMIACGSSLGSAVPAAQASAIASSAAVAAAPAVSVATSSVVVISTTSTVTQGASTFTSGASQLASTAVVISGQGAAPAVSTATATLTQTAAANNPVAAAPAVSVSTAGAANINLSSLTLNSVLNLGALVQQPTAGPVA